MRTLKPKSKNVAIYYVPTDIREVTTTDVTYQAMDMELIKRYFPDIYKNIVGDMKLKRRGSKE